MASRTPTPTKGLVPDSSLDEAIVARHPTPPRLLGKANGSGSRVPARALSPIRAIGKNGSPFRERPSTGQLRLKTAVAKRLFSDENGERQREIVGTSKASALPSPSQYTLQGVKTPTGYGKVFIPRINKEEVKMAESVFSSPVSPRAARRRRSPPPIQGPPGTMEFSEEEKEEPTLETLREEVRGLRAQVNNLEERLAEETLGRMDMEDKFNVLRKAFGAKLRRLAVATGHPEAINIPSP